MTKTQWNFYIDILMFFCMAAIAGIGFLMKYVLLPGKEAWALYGKKVELSWLGLDRHDWGAIHLYLAFVLLGLLVLHIILHWQTIVSLWRHYLPEGRRRSQVTIIFLLVCAGLLLLPFFINPEVADDVPGRGTGRYGRATDQIQDGQGREAPVGAKPAVRLASRLPGCGKTRIETLLTEIEA